LLLAAEVVLAVQQGGLAQAVPVVVAAH